MNIKQAAVQIKNAMRVYFMKDEFGNYIMPAEKQRPVFLVGAPGIGKTAIMEQIAHELNVGLVTYSMTHHTRQSALGLPYITTKNYDGRDYEVSEYTMSEIIASVYEYMEQTGTKEGILFLDEINCVSETLAPSMLQFLQYKVFGTHSVPEGWIVVTAGNPPEFNKSVKEFDIATLDRLKKIDIEPDYKVWREYAVEKGIHPAIINYLDVSNNDFYHIESLASGKSYVTARGWEDLSQMLLMYEKADIEVTTELIIQYIQNKKTTADFADSYFIYNKYKALCLPSDIVKGKYDEEIINHCRNASSQERLCIIGSLQNTVSGIAENVIKKENAVKDAVSQIKQLTTEKDMNAGDVVEIIEQLICRIKNILNISTNNTVLKDSEKEKNAVLAILERILNQLKRISPEISGNIALKNASECISAEMQSITAEARDATDYAIKFIITAFGKSNEASSFFSSLAENRYTSQFIRRHGSEQYSVYAESFCLTDRHNEIMKKIENLKN